MGVLAVIVRRHVTRDYDHWHTVERRISHACRGVRQTWSQVGQQYGGGARNTRITVGGVCRDLLVSDIDKAHFAIRQSGQYGNVGVATQAEDVPHATALEVAHQMIGYSVAHDLERFRVVELAEQLPIGRAVLRGRSTHPGDLHEVLEVNVLIGTV